MSSSPTSSPSSDPATIVELGAPIGASKSDPPQVSKKPDEMAGADQQPGGGSVSANFDDNAGQQTNQTASAQRTDQMMEKSTQGNPNEPGETGSETRDEQLKSEKGTSKKNEQNASRSSDTTKDQRPEKPSRKPSGGYDATPLRPLRSPTYTVRFIFHRAHNLPVADLRSMSCDPYLLVQLNPPSSVQPRHKEEPRFRHRTDTIHENRHPEWQDEWIVAGVPSDGPTLVKIRIYDEDRSDQDDRLGDVKFQLRGIGTSQWKDINEQEFDIQKRKAGKRSNLMRFCCNSTELVEGHNPHKQGKKDTLVLSVQVLGRTEKECGKLYTLGPLKWRQHYSPLVGRVTGTEIPGEGQTPSSGQTKQHQEGQGGSAAAGSSSAPSQAVAARKGSGRKEKPQTEKYDFQANQLQLQGPVPNELYHRFVDFKPWTGGMFRARGLRGKVMSHALHMQHARIYAFNKNVKSGLLDPPPSKDIAKKFLELVHYDQGGRMFTYMISLDGLMRFTETGKEFGIDFLSKHTMHSDISVYVAWAGEFLIRRLAQPHTESQGTHPPNHVKGGPPDEDPPTNPEMYELIIDNDSGTFRPNAELSDLFRKFLEANFVGLKVRVMSSDDDELDKIKDEQCKIKQREGDRRTFVQDDDGDLSSSDEEDLDRRAKGGQTKKEKRFNAVANPKAALMEKAN